MSKNITIFTDYFEESLSDKIDKIEERITGITINNEKIINDNLNIKKNICAEINNFKNELKNELIDELKKSEEKILCTILKKIKENTTTELELKINNICADQIASDNFYLSENKKLLQLIKDQEQRIKCLELELTKKHPLSDYQRMMNTAIRTNRPVPFINPKLLKNLEQVNKL